MRLKQFLLFISVFFLCLRAQALYDLKILEISNYQFELPGSYDVSLVFQNTGSQDIQYFQFKWSIDNVLIDSMDVDILNYWSYPLVPNTTAQINYFTLTIPSVVSLYLEGEYDFKIWISKVHGSSDINQANDTIHHPIQIVDYLPVKHVLLEKFSHTTCNPCYGGDLDAEELMNNYNNLSLVTVHDGASDPMNFSNGTIIDDYFSVGVGHPNFVFDRFKYAPNSVFGSTVWDGNCYNLNRRLLMNEGLEVSIVQQTYNAVTRELKVTLRANLYANYHETIAFNLYVLEDSVHGYQASAPDPLNYYHMHVAREVLGGPFGINITTPTTDGSTIEHNFTYVLPNNFNETNISIIGFVQRNHGSQLDVVNSTETMHIQDSFLQVKAVKENTFNLFPNPATNTIYIETDFEISQVELFDSSGNLVLKGSGKKIDINDLTKGAYYVKITSNLGAVYKKMIKL